MSRGLGEMQVIALLAFRAHEESDPPCWQSTRGGFVPVHDLRQHAWGDRRGDLARYRGTPDLHRYNYPNSFKRALDRLVVAGYAEFRYIDHPDRWGYGIRTWQNQYRLTEKGLSVLAKCSNTYPAERLTVEHHAVICGRIDAEIDARLAAVGIPRLHR
ncbi:MAG TPA: hypothetical protein VKB79_09485 [Bryobacteraceae bacterium]|nr:hypothetical protein [Bryobacteraceae bacterium]